MLVIYLSNNFKLSCILEIYELTVCDLNCFMLWEHVAQNFVGWITYICIYIYNFFVINSTEWMSLH